MDKNSDELSAAVSLHSAGNLAGAVELYRRFLICQPSHFVALQYLGMAHCQLGRFAEGAQTFGRAVVVNPQSADAHVSLGRAQQALGLHAEALSSFQAALELRPQDAVALLHLGMSCVAFGKHAEALESYERVLGLQPQYLEALYNSGNALVALGRAEEALARYEAVLALQPSLADAHNNRGNVLRTLGRHSEALGSYEQALALRADFADAKRNAADLLQSLGYQLYQQGRVAEARELFERALRVDDRHPFLAGASLHAALAASDWSDVESRSVAVVEGVRAGKRCIDPCAFLSVCDSPMDQLACARIWVGDQARRPAEPLWRGERYVHGRIRVAYLSADFREHAVAYLAAGLFEAHDRSHFEVFGISFGPDRRDAMRVRLEGAFERFFEVSESSDAAIARLLRENEIDIAVDLTGFTGGSRPGILALRPAPVQVSYLGFAGTTGAAYIDYLIADRTVIPVEEEPGYAEKVVCLPHSFQVNDNRRPIAAQTPSRQELGLPDTGFVFCCFNNGYKISPAVFDVWMRLLARVPGSLLWLSQGDPVAAENLRREARARGVEPGRLIFAPKTLGAADHLARYRRADLFLDTLPYNAHTTASDALWAGLPVLTCLGKGFAARVGASLLRAVGMAELITQSLAEYEELAYSLASEPRRLGSLRGRLVAGLQEAPLFDTDGFRRDIERAYLLMWERQQAGAEPIGFELAPAPRRRDGELPAASRRL